MKGPEVEVLVLAKHEVEKLVTLGDARAAAESAFRAAGTQGQMSKPENKLLFMDPPANGKFMLAMPAHIRSEGVAGIKWTNVYRIQESGIPAMWGGIVVLNHPSTGIPYAIVEATAITHMRTAGGHAAVAANHLARKDSRVMAIIGCGGQARAGLRSFADLFPLEVVQANDINPEIVKAFQREMSSEVPAEIMIAESPKKAVEGADIVMIGTWSEQPILMAPWVAKGCFVAALRRFKDVDPLLSRKADKWVLGNRDCDGDFNIPDIGLSYDHVYADMGEIVTGAKPGRENDRERILYTHMGMGAHDIALAQIAYTNAIQQGIGTRVRLI